MTLIKQNIPLKVATVFSGIGAFEQALQQSNIDHEIVFACDNGERLLPYTSEDINEMIKSLKESCSSDNENIKELSYLPEAVHDYLFGKFKNDEILHNEKWITEQYDFDWIRNPKDPQVKYLQEKFGVKKLKKIPSDLVAYITIEAESIRDANDKMMIASYCISKLEIVEWYIELLEVGSKKYIVPHTKPYLETVRTQLLACLQKIMDTKVTNGNRPLIKVNYPTNYEG